MTDLIEGLFLHLIRFVCEFLALSFLHAGKSSKDAFPCIAFHPFFL